MNTVTQLLSEQPLVFQPLRPGELANVAQKRISWLWDGYLAPGKVTALISPPKVGKTTLASHFLAHFEKGGQLAGLAVAAGQALVVTEEAAPDWEARCRQLAIGPNVRFICRPFRGARPTEEQWFALIASLEALHHQEALDLIVIDALAPLLPGNAEMMAAKMLDCLLPLQALANLGPAVWLLHHPAKKRGVDGQTSRGTGALSGFADIIMEMSSVRRARSRDRRRRICAYSRYVETPRHLILELSADGADYTVRTDSAGTPLVKTCRELLYVLENATDKLTQQVILDRWPMEDNRPDRTTLLRWLKRAARQSLICCAGTGYRGDPFVYWLPGHEPLLWPGNRASEADKEAWRERVAAWRRAQRDTPAST